MKQKIDLYDIVYSDFSNNFEDNEDIYWALKNYNGEAGDFLSDLKQYKMINVDEDGDATPHTLEVPYQARETILNMLNKSIYSDAMGLDTSILAGGSLTNVAIKANMMDLEYFLYQNLWNIYWRNRRGKRILQLWGWSLHRRLQCYPG